MKIMVVTQRWMTVSRRRKLQDGDVFTIPIDQERNGVGQIAASLPSSYYMGVFDVIVPSDEIEADVERLVQYPVLFAALSMDALLSRGYWNVIGNCAVSQAIELPAYKEMTVSGMQIIDLIRGRHREATALESSALDYRETFAPAWVDHALKAHFGALPWNPAYDKLRPNPAVAAKLFF